MHESERLIKGHRSCQECCSTQPTQTTWNWERTGKAQVALKEQRRQHVRRNYIISATRQLKGRDAWGATRKCATVVQQVNLATMSKILLYPLYKSLVKSYGKVFFQVLREPKHRPSPWFQSYPWSLDHFKLTQNWSRPLRLWHLSEGPERDRLVNMPAAESEQHTTLFITPMSPDRRTPLMAWRIPVQRVFVAWSGLEGKLEGRCSKEGSNVWINLNWNFSDFY